jgi:hypothetical protein
LISIVARIIRDKEKTDVFIISLSLVLVKSFGNRVAYNGPAIKLVGVAERMPACRQAGKQKP